MLLVFISSFEAPHVVLRMAYSLFMAVQWLSGQDCCLTVRRHQVSSLVSALMKELAGRTFAAHCSCGMA